MGASQSPPDINEAHDPFSSLLKNMHFWGLHKGRYALSDIDLLEKVGDDRLMKA